MLVKTCKRQKAQQTLKVANFKEIQLTLFIKLQSDIIQSLGYGKILYLCAIYVGKFGKQLA